MPPLRAAITPASREARRQPAKGSGCTFNDSLKRSPIRFDPPRATVPLPEHEQRVRERVHHPPEPRLHWIPHASKPRLRRSMADRRVHYPNRWPRYVDACIGCTWQRQTLGGQKKWGEYGGSADMPPAPALLSISSLAATNLLDVPGIGKAEPLEFADSVQERKAATEWWINSRRAEQSILASPFRYRQHFPVECFPSRANTES